MEEISRHPNIQAVAWGLLAAFSQIYNDNQEQKTEVKDLKYSSGFFRKEVHVKF